MKRACATSIVLATLAVAFPAQASAVNLGTAHGLTYVKETVTMPNGFVRDAVFAECPGATTSVGGGSTIRAPGAEHRTFISGSSGSNPDGWLTQGYHVEIVGKAKLTSWAVCANFGNAVKKFTKVSSTGFHGPSSATATCNTGDPIGGGLSVSPTKDWFLTASFPGFDPDEPNDPNWFAAGYHTQVSDVNFTVDVTCLLGGDPTYPNGPLTSSAEKPQRIVGCRPRESVVSGGYGFNSGDSSSHIIDARPVDLGDNDKVPDDAWSMIFYNDSGQTQQYYHAAVCL